MIEIIDCYKNYIKNEGYEIVENGDGTGRLILKGDYEDSYEYDKEYFSQEELEELMFQECIYGTDAIIDASIENVTEDIHMNEGKISVQDFRDKLNYLVAALSEIIFQIKYIDYEIAQKMKQGVENEYR